jgi:RHS repeat-associated protein
MIFPAGSGVLLADTPRIANAFLDGATAPVKNLPVIWNWLFGSNSRPRRQRQTLADRISRVASIHSVSPEKRVGYQNETVHFTAIAANASGATVQGVKFSFESSDVSKLVIDESGMALLKNPGQPWVTVRAGGAQARVPVLIRPGQRPAQSNTQFDSDQSGLSTSGATTGMYGRPAVAAPDSLAELSSLGEAPLRASGAARAGRPYTADHNSAAKNRAAIWSAVTRHRFGSPLSKESADRSAHSKESLPPAAPALDASTSSASRVPSISPPSLGSSGPPALQAPCPAAYDSSDFGYDELWSQPANQVGAPPNRPIEPMKIGTVLPEQNNFNLAIPIYGLSGRGLGAGLTLHYNSRVWSKHGTAITYNPINGWPFVGFSLGFGRIFTYGSGANTKYVLVDPDGTRHYLGTGSDTTTGTYQTSDGGHVTFVGSKSAGGSLYSNDGTKVTISVINNLLLPTRIQDSNGNYVDIAYKQYGSGYPAFPWRQALWYVTDTLGRILQFDYDSCGNLTSITVPAMNEGTQVIARFDYQNIYISNSFSGLTVENLPSSYPYYVSALKHIYFPPTQTGYLFSYSAYGMIYNVSLRRAMTYDSGTGAISDGTQNAFVSFNYPTVASSLTDAPAFTQRTESPGGTYSYAITSDPVEGTKTTTITRPDSSQVLLSRWTNAAVGDDLLMRSQVKNSSGGVMAKSEIAYVVDSGGTTQVQSVISYDDSLAANPPGNGNPVKTDFDYDQHGNVTTTREYGFQVSGAWQTRRRTLAIYKTDSAYINAYLRGLVIESDVYDGKETTSEADDVLMAKTTNTLDDYSSMQGMEGYSGQPEATNHLTSFNTSYTTRGNVTGVTTFKQVNPDQGITRLRKLDKYGNVVKEQASCCVEQTFTIDQTNGYSAPLESTSGTGSGALTSSVDPDFNTGLVVSATNPRGQTASYEYDSASRQTEVTYPSTAIVSATYNDSTLSASSTATYDEGAVPKTVTTTRNFDGWGRLTQSIQPNGGQVNTAYDSMGRTQSVTNPFQSGQSPGASTSYSYDALGRTKVVTLPDGQTVQSIYNGDAVTSVDQVSRKVMRVADCLGRLVKVTEQDASGNLTQDTTYAYDILGNLIDVNQGGQHRLFKYDTLSRLLYEKIPEQTATINEAGGSWTCKYVYNDSNLVTSKTDARGVITTYGYDSLNRLTSVSYNTSGTTATATPGVTYTYDNTSGSGTIGLLLSVVVGTQSSESYYYDSLKRLSSLTRTIGTHNYTTGYQYNEAGQLTQLAYPSGRAVNNYSHDSAGNVTNDGAHSYGYDAENRLVSVDGGSTATYIYDHQNRRLKKSVGSGTHYVWQGYQVLSEHNASSGAVLVDYICGGGQMIAKEDGSRKFFLNDRLSVRATITDGNGGIQGVQSHLPFGELLALTGQIDKHQFTSYERDSETQLDYAVNRHYSQIAGRFISKDPYNISGCLASPQKWARYTNATNDCINVTDALGLDCKSSSMDSFGIEGSSDSDLGPTDVHEGGTLDPVDQGLIDSMFGTGFGTCSDGGRNRDENYTICFGREFQDCLGKRLNATAKQILFLLGAISCVLACLAEGPLAVFGCVGCTIVLAERYLNDPDLIPLLSDIHILECAAEADKKCRRWHPREA